MMNKKSLIHDKELLKQMKEKVYERDELIERRNKLLKNFQPGGKDIPIGIIPRDGLIQTQRSKLKLSVLSFS